MRAAFVLCLVCAGCGAFGDYGDASTATDGGSTTGYGRPTLQVTVNGATTGLLNPDPGSVADIVDIGESGRLTQSNVSIVVSSAQAGVSCQLSFQRYGENVPPIGVGNHQVVATPLGASGISTVSPQGSLTVIGAGTSWSCAGGSCDGTILSLQTATADHVEGFYNGRLLRADGASIDEVVCSFYVPTNLFQR